MSATYRPSPVRNSAVFLAGHRLSDAKAHGALSTVAGREPTTRPSRLRAGRPHLAILRPAQGQVCSPSSEFMTSCRPRRGPFRNVRNTLRRGHLLSVRGTLLGRRVGHYQTTRVGRNRNSRFGVRTVSKPTFIHRDCQWRFAWHVGGPRALLLPSWVVIRWTA